MDIRRITLSEYELTAALVTYQRMTPEFLPGAKIAECKPTHDGKVMVTLEGETKSRRSEHTLKASDVLKPLIRFCLENNIMLPRNGQKSVSIADGKVALYVVLNLDIDLAGSLDPMRVTHLNRLTPADLSPETVRTDR
jgi:hypothetical protein